MSRASKKNSKKSSRDTGSQDDKKHQRQIYISQELIDFVEEDRREQEQRLREEYGLTQPYSWSAHVASILERCRQAKVAGKDIW